jgi:hypothetical protein
MSENLIDIAFSQALAEARPGFRGAALRRGAGNVSASLIAWLRSDRTLPEDAGAVLAAYFAGDLAARRGRQRVVAGTDFVSAVRNAARAYSRHASEMRAAAKTTSARLIEILRTAPLEKTARAYLADFIAGQTHPAGGKTWGVRKNQDDRALGAAIADHKAALRQKGTTATVAEADAVQAFKNDPRAIRRKHSVLERLMHTTAKARKAQRG